LSKELADVYNEQATRPLTTSIYSPSSSFRFFSSPLLPSRAGDASKGATKIDDVASKREAEFEKLVGHIYLSSIPERYQEQNIPEERKYIARFYSKENGMWLEGVWRDDEFFGRGFL
jgi:hypothetical protein